MKKDNYIIAVGKDISSLIQKVNVLYDEGYKAVGGVECVIVEGADVVSFQFIQSMEMVTL